MYCPFDNLAIRKFKVEKVREENKAVSVEVEPEKLVCYEDEMKARAPVNVRKVGGVYKNQNITVIH